MKTVLIADDEPNIVLSLQYLLERAGHRVLAVHDGREVLDALARHRIDLLLLDIMMPGLSGYEVCERIRADRAFDALRVVMLTAKGREVDRAKGLALGCDAFVTKPFSTSELLEVVQSQLGEE